MNNNSPLEYLLAFAITFAAGVASTQLFKAYIDRVKQKAKLSR